MYKNQELIKHIYKLIHNSPDIYAKYLKNLQIEIYNDWPEISIKIRELTGITLVDTTMKYLPSDKYNESEALLFDYIAKNDGGWFPYRSFTEFVDIKIHEKLEQLEFKAMEWLITTLVHENICNIFVVKEEVLENVSFNKIKFSIKEVMEELRYTKIEWDNNSYYCMVIAEI